MGWRHCRAHKYPLLPLNSASFEPTAAATGRGVKATIILAPQRRDSAAAIAAASELAMKKEPAAILLVAEADHPRPASSIFDPVIQVLDHFVLKANDALLVPPPVIDVVLKRRQSQNFDTHPNAAQLSIKNPTHPSARKNLSRDDDALDPVDLGPRGQGARFLIGV
jgi:hypothetical protein